MSLERIQKTILWKKTLASIDNDEYSSQRDELRTAFVTFRKNTSYLVSKISEVLPNLTQHDITHLDALWETASLIAGDDFELTPLEGFVLGGAILLHDSALCFEAYEKGQEGVRIKDEWKDAYASLIDSSKTKNEEELIKQADFEALRNLHANQAESLLEHNWMHPETKEKIYLLENPTLRKNLGKLIGQIAASHHWDIDTLAVRLSGQENVFAPYPKDWRIDPVKIACLLRCADAAHIDSERAPDFLHALIKRQGVSFNHWQAQNKLASVDIDQADNTLSTLLFTSIGDFKEEEEASWWIAYDAICLVDKEIKSSNDLLGKRTPSISFKVKKVKGVESPETMSTHVKVTGWNPCSAKVHVSNIEKLVSSLGGEMLYGSSSDTLGVAIRELIQNSRDSIQARKAHDKDEDFKGKIRIIVNNSANSTYLTVEDNGIGMSERVLLSTLLDFGTSFWTSDLIKSEFPGLRSSKFKSVGKFGIGFYAVFMAANNVSVATKRFDEGKLDVKVLKFNSGFSLRPLLTKGLTEEFGTSLSTQVKLKLKDNILPNDLMIEIKTNTSGSVNFYVPFNKFLTALCAGLDVSIFYKENDGEELKIHENIESLEFNSEKWLNDISFSKFQDNENIDYISKNIKRLKPIIQNGKTVGLAAINTLLTQKQNFLNISTVGGLAPTVHHRDGEEFIGFIDHLPKSARRETGEFVAKDSVIKDWAMNQLEELLTLNLNPIEKNVVASALCRFNVDPSQIAMIQVTVNNQYVFYSFDQLARLSSTMGIAFFEVKWGGHIDTHHSYDFFEGYALVKPLLNNSFLGLKIKDGIPVNNNTILDCLYRAIIKLGLKPKISIFKIAALNLFGQQINVISVSSE